MFEAVAPIIPVRDLDAALGRYRQLGFDVRAYSDGERYYVDPDGTLHRVGTPI